MIQKYSTIAGQVPTIPLTDDHEDGTWLTTDLYVGELFLNTADGKAWFRAEDGIIQISGTGGSASFIGDYVNIAGGTFSGTVYAPTFSANGITASYIIADIFEGGTFNGAFTGDGSGLTGIDADWLGGTVSNPSQFLNDLTLSGDTFLDGPIYTNNSFIDIRDNVNISGGAGVSASFFIGDGSGLTNIPVGTYSNTFTTGASASGYIISFERNDGATYTVDIEGMFGTSSNMTNAVWDDTNNTLTLIFGDGTQIAVPISTFDNLSVYGAVNADEVYANDFYGGVFHGIFNGTFSNDIYTTGATLSGSDAIFTRTDGITYSLDLSSFTPVGGGGATPSLSDVLIAGNETGVNDIVLSDTGSIYSTQIAGPTANVFSAGYKFHDIGGWAPRIETVYNNNTNFIQIEDSDTYISNRQTNLPSIDNQGLITVSPVIVELRNDDLVAGDFGTVKINDYQVQTQVYNGTTNNTSTFTQGEYENLISTSIAGITPSGDVMSSYARTWGNTAQIGSGLNATNTTQTMSANIEAQYDGSHIQNILTATDGTDSTGIVQRYYEIVTYGDVATFKGIQYLTDYSANYNGRSLVDKDYVDSAIAFGPGGPAGATGATGPAGPAGPAGATGANGINGATGPAGPAGATGANGINGATGPAGPAGATGPAGTPGSGTASMSVINTSVIPGYRRVSNTQKTYRLTRPYTGFTSGTVTVNGESVYTHSFFCEPGSVINEIAFRIQTAGAAGLGLAACRVLIYRSKLNGAGEVVGGDLELDTGVNVSTLSPGIKIVTGLNHTLSNLTYKDQYFMALRNFQSGALSVKSQANGDTITWYSEFNTSGTTMERDNAWYFSAPFANATPTAMPGTSSNAPTTATVAPADTLIYMGFSAT